MRLVVMATQSETVRNARYFVGSGILLADDFISKAIPPERMKKVDLKGVYVIRLQKPTPCTLFVFGIGGAWLPKVACMKYSGVTSSEPERLAQGAMMREIDPDNTYKLRVSWFHVDLRAAKAKIIREPGIMDLAHLQIKYHRVLHTNVKSKAKRHVDMAAKIRRAIREMDKRAYEDAGILPPEDRRADFNKFLVSKAYREKNVIDSDAEDSDDDSFPILAERDRAKQASLMQVINAQQEARKAAIKGLFGSDAEGSDDAGSGSDSDSADPHMLTKRTCEDESELGPSLEIGGESEMDDEIELAPVRQCRKRAGHVLKRKTLEEEMRSTRAQSRQVSLQQQGIYQSNPSYSAGDANIAMDDAF